MDLIKNLAIFPEVMRSHLQMIFLIMCLFYAETYLELNLSSETLLRLAVVDVKSSREQAEQTWGKTLASTRQ